MSLPEQHTYVSNNICGIDLYFLCLKSQWDPPKPSKCSNPAIICARCNKVTTQNSKTRDLGYPFGGIFTIQLVSDLITLIYRAVGTDNGRVGIYSPLPPPFFRYSNPIHGLRSPCPIPISISRLCQRLHHMDLSPFDFKNSVGPVIVLRLFPR